MFGDVSHLFGLQTKEQLRSIKREGGFKIRCFNLKPGREVHVKDEKKKNKRDEASVDKILKEKVKQLCFGLEGS